MRWLTISICQRCTHTKTAQAWHTSRAGPYYAIIQYVSSWTWKIKIVNKFRFEWENASNGKLRLRYRYMVVFVICLLCAISCDRRFHMSRICGFLPSVLITIYYYLKCSAWTLLMLQNASHFYLIFFGRSLAVALFSSLYSRSPRMF